MKHSLRRNFNDSMYCLRIDSGGSVEYKRATLVTIYAIMTGIYSDKFVYKLIKESLPMYIEDGVIPMNWGSFITLYELSHVENDGTNIMKKKGK